MEITIIININGEKIDIEALHFLYWIFLKLQLWHLTDDYHQYFNSEWKCEYAGLKNFWFLIGDHGPIHIDELVIDYIECC